MVDRQGNEVELPVSNSFVYPRFSPNGTRIAVQIDDGDNANIFIYDIPSGRLDQLTFDGGEIPLWTPDGTKVTFLANDALWNSASDFSEEPQLLSTAGDESGREGPLSWSPNQRVLLRGTYEFHSSLTLLEAGGVEPGESPGNFANFSGDGTWLSYLSAGEVFVQPYPLGSGQRRRVTEDGGDLPVWSRNGRELFYENDGQLWAVEITTEPTADWEDPVALFETPWLSTGGGVGL